MEQIEFVLGFKTLAEMIPDLVGEPLENEHFNLESGDSIQQTTGGLLVWRKADNWTAFSDGHSTWVNGPFGLQERLNVQRFTWEADYQHTLPAPLIHDWDPDSPNRWKGRPYGDPIAIVVHTAAGTEAGLEAVMGNPGSQVSAHYGIMLDGSIEEYVELCDRAWHAGILERDHRWYSIYLAALRELATIDGFEENPNNWTIGIETEDRGNALQVVTEEQFVSTAVACRLAMSEYPSIRFLTSHHVISPHSRPNCCGRRWIASGRLEQLAKDLGLTLFV